MRLVTWNVNSIKQRLPRLLAMIEVGLAQPWADPDRVVMAGMSHGGCVTLRALQRGAPLHEALALVPPTDMAALYRYLTERVGVLDGVERVETAPLLRHVKQVGAVR